MTAACLVPASKLLGPGIARLVAILRLAVFALHLHLISPKGQISQVTRALSASEEAQEHLCPPGALRGPLLPSLPFPPKYPLIAAGSGLIDLRKQATHQQHLAAGGQIPPKTFLSCFPSLSQNEIRRFCFLLKRGLVSDGSSYGLDLKTQSCLLAEGGKEAFSLLGTELGFDPPFSFFPLLLGTIMSCSSIASVLYSSRRREEVVLSLATSTYPPPSFFCFATEDLVGASQAGIEGP